MTLNEVNPHDLGLIVVEKGGPRSACSSFSEQNRDLAFLENLCLMLEILFFKLIN